MVKPAVTLYIHIGLHIQSRHYTNHQRDSTVLRTSIYRHCTVKISKVQMKVPQLLTSLAWVSRWSMPGVTLPQNSMTIDDACVEDSPGLLVWSQYSVHNCHGNSLSNTIKQNASNILKILSEASIVFHWSGDFDKCLKIEPKVEITSKVAN